MLITLHMFSLSVMCTLNTQLKLLPFKRYTVLRRTVNGNFILTPTVGQNEDKHKSCCNSMEIDLGYTGVQALFRN